MSKQKLFLIVFICIWGNCSKAQNNDFVWTPNLEKAYSDLQKLKLETGKKEILAEKEAQGIKIYLENYADLNYLLITEDQNYYKTAVNQEDTRLDLIDDLNAQSPYRLFIQAEIRIHWAFIKIKFGHEVAGAWEVIKAYRLLEENTKKFPAFLPNKKSLGLLHILIGSTPQSYLWVTKILGLKGDLKQGFAELQEVIKKDSIFNDESQLIDFLTRSYIIGMTEGDLEALKKYVRSHPDNLMLHLFGASMLIKNNQSDQAWVFLQNHPRGATYLMPPSFSYLRGEVLIQKGQYQEAIKQYQQYLTQSKGLNFIKDSYYKMYLCYWLMGEGESHKTLINKILTVGSELIEQDKVAQKFAKNYQTWRPNAEIMKSRMAFDGGFYGLALEHLNGLKEETLSQKDQAEFNYRKGRILQKTQETAKAIVLYEKAIGQSETEKWYFGAGASLQLGYIYLAKNQRDKAKIYFQKALNYPKHEYKNSIDNKAQAALNGL